MIIFKHNENISPQDSLIQKSDTSGLQIITVPDTVRITDTAGKRINTESSSRIRVKQVDTVSDGSRPVVTFYDPGNFILSSQEDFTTQSFPFTLLKTRSLNKFSKKEIITEGLREGEKPLPQPLKEDWLIFIILTLSVLYVFISTVYKRLPGDMKRFFLFMGIGDPVSYDMQLLFNWKSTIINLVSFMNIALLIYCAADFYEFIPEFIPGFLFWLIIVTGTVVLVSGRHIICIITGKISGKKELFNEYIITIYQSYRYLAIIFFILTIVILYTNIFNTSALFITGLSAFLLIYLIRIIRLFIIFLRYSISIFYFILYLCALEFLPVLIMIKYVTGLF